MVMFRTVDITTPLSGRVVYKDSYWLCEEGNPQKALFYGNTPQCNKSKSIAEHVIKNDLYSNYTKLQVAFIETAFVPQSE